MTAVKPREPGTRRPSSPDGADHRIHWASGDLEPWQVIARTRPGIQHVSGSALGYMDCIESTRPGQASRSGGGGRRREWPLRPLCVTRCHERHTRRLSGSLAAHVVPEVAPHTAQASTCRALAARISNAKHSSIRLRRHRWDRSPGDLPPRRVPATMLCGMNRRQDDARYSRQSARCVLTSGDSGLGVIFRQAHCCRCILRARLFSLQSVAWQQHHDPG